MDLRGGEGESRGVRGEGRRGEEGRGEGEKESKGEIVIA